MSTFERRRFLAYAGASLPALLATGCPSSDKGGRAEGGLRAGLVTDTAGVNDGSFNTGAWEGLTKAGQDFGFEIKLMESRRNADYVPNLSRFGEAGFDIVFAVGFLLQQAVEEAARRYPKTRFALIDGEAADLPNMVAYRFREEEGAFLVGALAALTSKTHVLGFVGGLEVPLIRKFECGYAAGARTAVPGTKVKVGYANSFDDPAKGSEIALLQMSAKADVLFHASGRTGLGVIKAVAGKGDGCYAIGVDRDQDDAAPGRVLTSMLKRVDVAVHAVCKRVKEGTFQAGTIEQGLAEGALGLSPMRFTKDVPPKGALEKVDGYRARIVSGDLVVPKTLDALAAYPPKG